jgi:PAS domain-containing protein
VINRGANVLIVDMSATGSCDHGGADAIARAYQRAAANGTQLRLIVTAPIVRRVLDVNGLDRLISIYPSLESAIAAGEPGVVVPLAPRPAGTGSDTGPPPGRSGRTLRRRRVAQPWKRSQHPAVTPAALWLMVDALADGVVLTGDAGEIALANRRLEEIFGYEHGELAGQPVEMLLPGDLRVRCLPRRAISLSPWSETSPRPDSERTWPTWPGAASRRCRFSRPRTCLTGLSKACLRSASACRPRPSCPMRRRRSGSPARCDDLIARSRRSVTMSLLPTLTIPIPNCDEPGCFGADMGEITDGRVCQTDRRGCRRARACLPD